MGISNRVATSDNPCNKSPEKQMIFFEIKKIKLKTQIFKIILLVHEGAKRGVMMGCKSLLFLSRTYSLNSVVSLIDCSVDGSIYH